MTHTDLKPCPFCGLDYVGICETDFMDRKAYAVSCRIRDCHGVIFTLGHGLFPTREEAVEAWNTRADTAPSLSADLIAEAEAEMAGVSPDHADRRGSLLFRAITALRAAEAQLSERSMEADVGKWVYSRIDALIDAKPGTAEAVELSYLTSAVGHIEEYGVENCEGHDLGGDALRAAEAENARLRAALKPFAGLADTGKHGGEFVIAHAIYSDMTKGVVGPRQSYWHWDDFERARRALGGDND